MGISGDILISFQFGLNNVSPNVLSRAELGGVRGNVGTPPHSPSRYSGAIPHGVRPA